MNTRIGYYVRCLNSEDTRFQKDEILRVTQVVANPDGTVFLGFDNNMPIWNQNSFEEIIVHESKCDNSVTYEKPEEMIEIPVREYLALLDAEMWWHSALLGKVREFCDWPDIVEHYLAIKKDEKELAE